MSDEKKTPKRPSYSPEERERRSKLGKLLYRWTQEGGEAKLGPFRPWAAKQDPSAAAPPGAKSHKRRPSVAAPGPASDPPQPPRPPGAEDPSEKVQRKATEISAADQRASGRQGDLFAWLVGG